MKSLTVRQPWASAFFLPDAPKDIENRTFDTDYRGDVAILAGLSYDRERAHLYPGDLPRGHAVGCYLGVVELVGTHLALPDCDCGEWAFQPAEKPLYHWVIANPRLLKLSVNALGHLGLRDVAPMYLDRVLAGLERTR